MQHPALYEINTRVWLRHFDSPDGPARLSDIPESYWDRLQDKGIHYVWMMGIWQTVTHKQILRYALIPDLQQAYSKTLPDWNRKDIIGSPYAVDRYQPAAGLGSWEELAGLRKTLHQKGMKLILDFVPNHFHAETSLVEDHPYLFLQGRKDLLQDDPATFFRYKGKVWAHGRDPYFPAWQDTIQVDYFNQKARDFMRAQLLELAGVCDGVRCDMAMLMLNSVFESTWRHTSGFKDYQKEFWEDAISRIKEEYPYFRFIAEAYWDLEWQLQQLGFDYTYDKRLLDRLVEGQVEPIRMHLFADPNFRNGSVRFLENHDEDRILERMNTRQAEAAAVITYTLPGMRFFHEGQWEGKRVRLPVQLGREPAENACTCVQADFIDTEQWPAISPPICKCTYVFYEKLLDFLQKPIFYRGEWEQLSMEEGGDYILAWQWRWEAKFIVIFINYSNHSVEGRLPAFSGEKTTIVISEPWKDRSYEHEVSAPMKLTLYPFEYRFLEFTIPG